MVGVQQIVDRADPAGRLAAPQREMGLRYVRRQHGDRIVRAHAQIGEQIGRLRHPGEQVGVGQVARRAAGQAGLEKSQRRPVAEQVASPGQHLPGRGGGHESVARGSLQRPHICPVPDNSRGGLRSSRSGSMRVHAASSPICQKPASSRVASSKIFCAPASRAALPRRVQRSSSAAAAPRATA